MGLAQQHFSDLMLVKTSHKAHLDSKRGKSPHPNLMKRGVRIQEAVIH